MKKAAKIYPYCLAAALLIMCASPAIAIPSTGTDTCFGLFAGNGDTCVYLDNATSASNDNTAYGWSSLTATTGTDSTGIGAAALYRNSGDDNTAVGSYTLYFNTGSENTATGYQALNLNGNDANTADGYQALYDNSGNLNTATGWSALYGNTGSDNTATGYGALSASTSGTSNTATGVGALRNNSTGNQNTGTGNDALGNNGAGNNNTADGFSALSFNNSGGNNTALGYQALRMNNGDSNIGIGYLAGSLLTSGTNNIDIGNKGATAESSTIRIGTVGVQTTTYIAGIKTSAIRGLADVVVTSKGQLGVMASSARYKRDIHDMGKSSDGLMKLRPVTFLYKDDPDSTRQYGLVAEEVERVYPELVVRDADGKVESVRYSTLTSMLLNELQKTRREVAEMKAGHDQEMRAMRASFEERLSRIERTIASKDGSRNLASALSR